MGGAEDPAGTTSLVKLVTLGREARAARASPVSTRRRSGDGV